MNFTRQPSMGQSHAGFPRPFASILHFRLSQIREFCYRTEKARFRSSRRCVDQVFTLDQHLGQRQIYQSPTIVVFLYTSVAFDSVGRPALLCWLQKNELQEKYNVILRAFYPHASRRVSVYTKPFLSFIVTSHVRQLFPKSTFFFNVVIEDSC